MVKGDGARRPRVAVEWPGIAGIRRLAVTLVAAAVWPAGAAAHGPNQCLLPDSGPPGTPVVVECPAYKVVFNPDRSDLAIGPESLWRRHVATSPPATVYRVSWRYSTSPQPTGARFDVPDIPEGRYLVAIYDGGEGGAHYTWDDFRVTGVEPGSAPAPDVAATRSGATVPVAASAGLAVAALVVGTALGWRLARHRS